jgi:hypothetical protein
VLRNQGKKEMVGQERKIDGQNHVPAQAGEGLVRTSEWKTGNEWQSRERSVGVLESRREQMVTKESRRMGLIGKAKNRDTGRRGDPDKRHGTCSVI